MASGTVPWQREAMNWSLFNKVAKKQRHCCREKKREGFMDFQLPSRKSNAHFCMEKGWLKAGKGESFTWDFSWGWKEHPEMKNSGKNNQKPDWGEAEKQRRPYTTTPGFGVPSQTAKQLQQTDDLNKHTSIPSLYVHRCCIFNDHYRDCFKFC